ncbi:MAG TPA: acetoin utilization protein AcuC [Thermoplasmata archaeon]|nr:acetoin utilization protein AcuC [Thermoplasmata archaeon]
MPATSRGARRLPHKSTPPHLIFDPGYQKYRFSDHHALREVRVRLAHDLIAGLGLLAHASEDSPAPAAEDAILSVHEPGYVKAVKRLSKDPRAPEPKFGLEPGDNPPFAGMYEAACLQAGGTLLASELVASGTAQRAYNLGGGFHHAMPARASGFCIFNDVAIGIRGLLKAGIRRVLYVDIDGHHGDGVQAIFYRDPKVLTISLHEDGRFLFPGSGFVDETGEAEGRGYSVNVPLPPHTRDPGWTRAFDSVVLPLAEAFRPEVLVTQTGADAHTLDPLTHLDLTTESYEHAGARFDEIARRWCEDRWIAVGGGGYDVTVAPRVWALLFAAMVRRRPANSLPEDWLQECRKLVRAEPPHGTLRDASTVAEDPAVSRDVARVIESVRATVFPFHGIQ